MDQLFDFNIEHVYTDKGELQGVPVTLHDVTFECGCMAYCDSAFEPEFQLCSEHGPDPEVY